MDEPRSQRLLTLEAAALLLARRGKLPEDDLKALLAAVAGDGGPGQPVQKVMRPLRADDVADRTGDTWYATSLADLATWIADGYEGREAAGYSDDPRHYADLLAAPDAPAEPVVAQAA